MTLEQAVKHFGTQSAVALALNLNPAAVAMWKKRGAIPPLPQLRLEKLTNGALKASEST